MLLDSQGRLLRKVNLLDLMALLFVLGLGGSLAYAVGVSRYRSLEVVSMEPMRIVAGPGKQVVFKGSGFDTATTIWIGNHSRRAGVYWDESTLGMEISDETPAGTYRITVRDGRGRSVVLPDPLEVAWVPQILEIRQRYIYPTGEGARLDILGRFFTYSRSIRIGDRELDVSESVDPEHISARLKEGDPPLPLGEHPVAVINAGGHSVTWERRVAVVPVPEVHSVQRILYPTGEGAHVDILGKFSAEPHSVRIGDRELDTSDRVSSEQISARLKPGTAPLPLGEYPVAVTNAEGQYVTLERGVTVIPAPEVHTVAPDRIILGDTVDVYLYGKNLRDGTLVWLEEQKAPVGQATLVSPDCLKIRITTDSSMRCKGNDVFLELPNGPKVKVLEDALYIGNAFQVFMVATVLLDDRSAQAIREFKGSLEWKLKPPPGGVQILGVRRNFNLDAYPLLEVLLPVRVEIAGGRLTTMDVRSRPLRKGSGVWFTLYGQELAGIVVSEPFAVFLDDYFADKRPL